MTVTVLNGDALEEMAKLESGSISCCITSPPYFGLRDYGVDGQIGLESTPDEYVAKLVEVFREVRRVLRDDATVWLNLGDAYAASTKGPGGGASSGLQRDGRAELTRQRGIERAHGAQRLPSRRAEIPVGLKPKDLIGIPWRVALALQADGWWLRSAIVWNKPNPMPESVRDRPTSAYEHVFLLTKAPTYFYDADAVREPWADARADARCGARGGSGVARYTANIAGRIDPPQDRKPGVPGRNLRNVWTITEPRVRLRHDLPPEKRAYVVAELVRRGLV